MTSRFIINLLSYYDEYFCRFDAEWKACKVDNKKIFLKGPMYNVLVDNIDQMIKRVKRMSLYWHLVPIGE